MPLHALGRQTVPLLAVTLFALFAAQPLFVGQLTCSDDSAFHIGRAVNLEALIDSGHFFPRWSPYMAHGYGYPFFNYYAPLTSYLLVALHKIGFIYPVAFHIALFLCLWIAGLAAYALARDWWGEAAGVAAAVVYLTAPYFAFDLLFRGNLAESFALALPPLIMLCLQRALRPTSESHTTARFRILDLGFWDLAVGVAFALLLLTHNATALATAPLIAGYVALLAYIHKDRFMLLRGGLGLALGLGLSACFWLPALLETGLVQTDKLLVPPIFTYYTNFIGLGELLAPPAVVDPLLINPSPPKALGLTAALLAMLGFAGALRGPHTRPFGIWLLAFELFYSALTLSISQPIWDIVPLLNFIQFPWRMLAPAALCAALLAGAAVQWLPARPSLAAAAVCLTATLGHLSWWYPRYCAPFDETTLADTLQYELDTFTLGTTAKGEYLPRTAPAVPADLSLAQSLIRGEHPQYLANIPADSTVEIENSDPLNYRVSLTLTSPAALTFNQFFFPGWAASLDSQPLTLSPHPETGLITFAVPPGRHSLHLYFGLTPLRALASAISILSLINLGILAILPVGQSQSKIQNPKSQIPNPQSPISRSLLLLPLALLLLRPLVINRTSNPLRHSAFDGQSLARGQTLGAHLLSGLTLLSTEFPASVSSGASFDALLYLSLRDSTPNAYRPRFDLIDANGLVWNDGNSALPPRWHREPPETPQWPPGHYAQWARRETILPGTPPGEYQLTVIVFDRSSLAPDSLIDEAGNPVAPVTALGTIHVSRPAAPPRESDLNLQHRADFDFGPLTLLGYNLDRAEARPGDTVLITLFLRADEPMPDDLAFNLFTPSYPTSQWQPGDLWRFQVFQRIPAEAASGPFRFSLRLTGGGAPSFDLAPIRLTAPDRVFTPPLIGNPTAIPFGDSIELAGYELQSDGGQLQITLLWHALATPEADLSAFIHLEDAAGRIVAQSDGVPANWSRPTTGWVAGEYILDPRLIESLPPGEYRLFVGLADRLTGARLPAPDGDRAGLGIYKAP